VAGRLRLGNAYDRGGIVKGSEGRKVTEKDGRDADGIEILSSVVMVEVARPLRQRAEFPYVKGHGLL